MLPPPVLARLNAATGDKKYVDFLNTMWWDTTDFLFDPEAKLYYRDKNYFGKLTPNGKKIFWARGNGWVMGGTVRVNSTVGEGSTFTVTLPLKVEVKQESKTAEKQES